MISQRCFFPQCYEFDKFEGYATEAEAVNRGLTLMKDSKLWGVIIFHASSENDVEKLPRNITYKLRYFIKFVHFSRLL